MKRRDLLKLGASVAAVPAAGLAQQQHHTAADAKQIAAGGISAGDWKPELFDDHENQTLIALVDLIIPATDTPGAKAALANRHIDHILAAASEDDKARFREGLWWIDGYAMRRYGKAFTGCTTAEQTAILQTLDEGKDTAAAPGHQFFPELKGVTTQIYYSTEIGFRELNKGGQVPATFACPHPEHP